MGEKTCKSTRWVSPRGGSNRKKNNAAPGIRFNKNGGFNGVGGKREKDRKNLLIQKKKTGHWGFDRTSLSWSTKPQIPIGRRQKPVFRSLGGHFTGLAQKFRAPGKGDSPAKSTAKSTGGLWKRALGGIGGVGNSYKFPTDPAKTGSHMQSAKRYGIWSEGGGEILEVYKTVTTRRKKTNR